MKTLIIIPLILVAVLMKAQSETTCHSCEPELALHEPQLPMDEIASNKDGENVYWYIQSANILEKDAALETDFDAVFTPLSNPDFEMMNLDLITLFDGDENSSQWEGFTGTGELVVGNNKYTNVYKYTRSTLKYSETGNSCRKNEFFWYSPELKRVVLSMDHFLVKSEMITALGKSTEYTEKEVSNASISVRPNPVNDFCKVTISESGTLNILDFSGKVVKTIGRAVAGDNHVDCSDLISGKYIVELLVDGEMTASTVMIKL